MEINLTVAKATHSGKSHCGFCRAKTNNGAVCFCRYGLCSFETILEAKS